MAIVITARTMATTATLVNISRRRAAANGAPGGSAGPFTQRLRCAIQAGPRALVGSVPGACLVGGADGVVCVSCGVDGGDGGVCAFMANRLSAAVAGPPRARHRAGAAHSQHPELSVSSARSQELLICHAGDEYRYRARC